MGWDAYSSAKRDLNNDRQLCDVEIATSFAEASKFVIDKFGKVDWDLINGCLDCSSCGPMLSKAVLATNYSIYDEHGWTDIDVHDAFTRANWDFHYHPEQAWAYWSARKFLEVCSLHGLSISFSY